MARHNHAHGQTKAVPRDPRLEAKDFAEMLVMPHSPKRDVDHGQSASRFQNPSQFGQPLIAPCEIVLHFKAIAPMIAPVLDAVKWDGEGEFHKEIGNQVVQPFLDETRCDVSDAETR